MYINFFATLVVFYIVFIPWNRILLKFKLVKNKDVAESVISFKNWKYSIPLFILAMNFLYGVFRIDSYPFSVYPVYAAIVPETFKYFEYKIKDKGLENVNVHQLGKESNFSWESYSRFEPEIITKYEEKGIVDAVNIIQQWKRWQNAIPVLNNIDSIEIYAVEIPLSPEKQKDTVEKYKLMDLCTTNTTK